MVGRHATLDKGFRGGNYSAGSCMATITPCGIHHARTMYHPPTAPDLIKVGQPPPPPLRLAEHLIQRWKFPRTSLLPVSVPRYGDASLSGHGNTKSLSLRGWILVGQYHGVARCGRFVLEYTGALRISIRPSLHHIFAFPVKLFLSASCLTNSIYYYYCYHHHQQTFFFFLLSPF
jgi:hypothetical protein